MEQLIEWRDINLKEGIMKISISEAIVGIYKKSHRNINSAVITMLDSFDPKNYIQCFADLQSFELKGKKADIELGSETVSRIIEDFELEEIDIKIAEVLIWMAATFPEV